MLILEAFARGYSNGFVTNAPELVINLFSDIVRDKSGRIYLCTVFNECDSVPKLYYCAN